MPKLFADYLKEEDDNPATVIMSVAELMRKDADSEGKVAKTSIPFFLMQLRNAGLPISYTGLKAYYNAHPELNNVIQTFNDEEIIFVGQGDEAEGETLGKPEGDVPPEEVVDKMAKRAMNKRVDEVEEGYYVMPPMDKDRYQERDGLEGPFQTRSGKVVYYDPKEGSYYDPDSDFYLSYEDFMSLDNSKPDDFEITKMELPKKARPQGKTFYQGYNDRKSKGIKSKTIDKDKWFGKKESVEEKFDYWQSADSLAKLAGVKKG